MAVFGAEYGMGSMNSFLKARNDKMIYCVPDWLILTGDQIIDVLKLAVKEQPSWGEQPYGMAMVLAFQRIFPCPK